MCSTTVILTVSTGDAVSIYAVCDARLKVRFRVGYVGVGCQSFSLRWMMSWGVARKGKNQTHRRRFLVWFYLVVVVVYYEQSFSSFFAFQA